MKTRILPLLAIAALLLVADVFAPAALAQPAPAGPRGRGPQGPQVVSPEVAADRHVTFRILAPKAEAVKLSGDISGAGQTRAAHELCTGVAREHQFHYDVVGAGHYGIFSGRRWRESVYPQVRKFIAAYLDADPTIVRLALVLATLMTGPGAPLLYLIAWFVIPLPDEA